MKKQEYELSKAEIIRFESESVIVTSTFNGKDGDEDKITEWVNFES